MVKERECRKMFNKIVEGKENKGYVEWEAWVSRQVEEYDVDKLQNLVKRIELKKIIAEEESYLRRPGITTQCMSLATLLITVMVTVLLASMNSIFNVYNGQIDKAMLQEYAELVSSTMLEFSGQLLWYCGIFMAVYMVLLVAEEWANKKILSIRTNTKMYYTELLKVLKKELKKRQPKKKITPEKR